MTDQIHHPRRFGKSKQATALVTLILVGSQFMVSMDATIVNVALPSMQDSLGLSGSALPWVVNAYALPFGGLLLLGARLGDYIGRRRVFIAGTLLFTVASLACGLASTPIELIAARGVQGVGAAAMSPVAMAILVAEFEGAQRNRVLGLWGAMSGLAGGVGMVAGGLLTSASWRWNFLVNVPVGVAVLAGSALLPPGRPRTIGRPDVIGAMLAAVGLSTIAYGVAIAGESGWTSYSTLGSLGSGAVVVALFTLWQRRAETPLVHLGIFRNRAVSIGIVIVAITGALGQVTYFTYTIYLQREHGFDPVAAGFAFLPISIILFAASTRVQMLIAKVGLRRSLSAGLMLSAVGLLWSTRIGSDESFASEFLGPSILWSLGWGIAQATSFIAAAQGTSSAESGTVSGLISTTYRLGGAIGLAAILSVAAASSTVLQSGGTGGDLLDGLRAAWWAGAGLAFIGALLSYALPSPQRTSTHIG
ncbi:MFS transporter [Rhodococcus sp. NPDC076796]|uniref:MFS transporter n=1 Tax=Rhodococcus sp. NPDC076796 TaxID=3154859 RepID=UPI00344F1CC0